MTDTLRYLTFLTVARCVRTRDYWIVLGFITVAFVARLYTGIPTPELVPTYLLIVPLLAGSGLLDTAREGRLDLLFASGASRREVWVVAAGRVLLLHSAVVLLMAEMVPPGRTEVATLALVTIALGNAALGFAGGLVRPAAGFGLVWLVVRMVFALTPQGGALRVHMIAVNDGQTAPVAWKLLVMALVLPEATLTRPHLPLYVPVTYLLVAGAALLLTYRIFVRASFSGHRKE